SELDEALADLVDPTRRREHDRDRAGRGSAHVATVAHRVLPAAYRETRLWVILTAILVTSAVVAELVSVKLFEVPLYSFLGWNKPFTLTAGALLWPLVFLTTDTINEFYGRKAVRFVTWVTMAMIGWTFVITTASIRIPAVGYSPVGDGPFAQVFGQSAWIIVGSMAAFGLSQIVDVTVFSAIRRALKGRHIWARATGSTIVSQLIDSFVVIYIAFWLPTQVGQPGVDAAKALDISLSSFTYKVGIAIALTPLIYVAHWAVERWLGHDLANRMSAEAHAA
ncbi:MAG: queuosine precursor transporter, partial [Deltaproteobacteria bacterium]|nr:queuosine precursor transporter [Deltaproteobacteria bacterium]